jgi:hypothetical protein
MQSQAKIISAALFSLLVITATPAQQGAAEVAASLRAQLTEVQTKQSELQMRLQQLGEALKPENIESSLAGVGSTHPEELRAQRRRQLENEKAGVSAQLEQLAISQRRLETAIAQADAAAYQQSARPNDPGTNTKGPNVANVDNSSNRTKRRTRHRSRRVKAKRSPRAQ